MRSVTFPSRVLSLAILVVGANIGAAKGQVSAGIHGSWGGDADFGVGARGVLALGGALKGFELVGQFDHFYPGDRFGADIAYWEVNTNLLYLLNVDGRLVMPYAGVGLNIAHLEASSHVLGVRVSGEETRTGFNLVGGLVLDAGGVQPFLEGRIELDGGDRFVVSAGVRL